MPGSLQWSSPSLWAVPHLTRVGTLLIFGSSVLKTQFGSFQTKTKLKSYLMNIKNFDIVLEMPIGLNSFTHSMTIFSSRKNLRKEKIKRIWMV
jgi:hypothetical protein